MHSYVHVPRADSIQEGYIVKWTILAVIVLLFTLWIVGGYWHAKKRIQKGLRPLAYHRVSNTCDTPSPTKSNGF